MERLLADAYGLTDCTLTPIPAGMVNQIHAIACRVLRQKLDAIERAGSVWELLTVDFDNLRYRPRGHEFMRAYAYCFEPFSGSADAFFLGWAGAVRPPAEEVAVLGRLWAYNQTVNLWPLEARYLRPAVYQQRWDRFIREPSDWWVAHHGRVTERFLALLKTTGGVSC